MTRRHRQCSRSAAAASIAVVLLAALGSGCGSSGGGSSSTAGGGSSSTSASASAPSLAPIHGSYSPKIDPANFVATIDNRYLPFKPGTTFHYEGVRGTTPQTDDEVVTNQTKQILGVRATVVRDTVSEHGKPVER